MISLWKDKNYASLRQLQSLIGKLNFVAACVRPGRVFINRLLNWLREISSDNNINPFEERLIPDLIKKDINWWDKFLIHYNGVSIMCYDDWSEPDMVFSSDACLQGAGAFCDGFFFHARFPDFILQQSFHISALEMLCIIVSIKLWGTNFRGKRIVVFCDNEAVCRVINSGSSRCEILQDCLRELCFFAAKYEFEIRARHLCSLENRLADHLSRWDLSPFHRERFFELTRDCFIQEVNVSENLFSFEHIW